MFLLRAATKKHSSSSPASSLIQKRFGHAVVFEKFGSPSEVLKFVKYDAPKPKSNEIFIKVLAAPIHKFDVAAITGHFDKGVGGQIGQFFPGSEGVGEVQEVGSGVNGISVGDWVVPTVLGTGTWRTELTAPAKNFRKIEKGLKVEQAATLSVCVPTAYALLNSIVPLYPGDTIVQNIASSTVGQLVIQMAALRNITTINIVFPRIYDAESRNKLKQIGGNAVIWSEYVDSPGMKDLLTEHEPPVYGINGAGGNDGLAVLKLLGKNAVCASYANTTKHRLDVRSPIIAQNNLKLVGFNLETFLRSKSPQEAEAFFNESTSLVRSGKVNVFIERHPFNETFLSSVARSTERFLERKLVFRMPDS